VEHHCFHHWVGDAIDPREAHRHAMKITGGMR
jgi:hypothetical protein